MAPLIVTYDVGSQSTKPNFGLLSLSPTSLKYSNKTTYFSIGVGGEI